MKALECLQEFSHYKSMGIYPDVQVLLTSQSMVRSGQISKSNFEVVLDFIVVLVTCTNEEEPIKNKGAICHVECSQH